MTDMKTCFFDKKITQVCLSSCQKNLSSYPIV